VLERWTAHLQVRISQGKRMFLDQACSNTPVLVLELTRLSFLSQRRQSVLRKATVAFVVPETPSPNLRLLTGGLKGIFGVL
jgi:hypothetical protein